MSVSVQQFLGGAIMDLPIRLDADNGIESWLVVS